MELSDYVVRVLLSLGVVLIILFLALPWVLKRLTGVKVLSGKGSFEVKKVTPLSKGIFIVELDIKGKTFVLCVSEKGADVIYREDGENSPSAGSSKPGGSRPDDTTR